MKKQTQNTKPRHTTVSARAPIPTRKPAPARGNGAHRADASNDWKNRTDTTFTKLRDGAWGLRGINLDDGAIVDVLMKDGSTKEATVGRVIWRSDDGTGLCLATVAKKAQREPGDDSDELPHGMR